MAKGEGGLPSALSVIRGVRACKRGKEIHPCEWKALPKRVKVIFHALCHFGNYLCPIFLDHKLLMAGLEKEADYFAYLLMREWMEE